MCKIIKNICEGDNSKLESNFWFGLTSNSRNQLEQSNLDLTIIKYGIKLSDGLRRSNLK